jgi:hypothetical protein
VKMESLMKLNQIESNYAKLGEERGGGVNLRSRS